MRVSSIARISNDRASSINPVSWYEAPARIESVGKIKETAREFHRVLLELESNPDRRQFRTIEIIYAKGLRAPRRVRLW